MCEYVFGVHLCVPACVCVSKERWEEWKIRSGSRSKAGTRLHVQSLFLFASLNLTVCVCVCVRVSDKSLQISHSASLIKPAAVFGHTVATLNVSHPAVLSHRAERQILPSRKTQLPPKSDVIQNDSMMHITVHRDTHCCAPSAGVVVNM